MNQLMILACAVRKTLIGYFKNEDVRIISFSIMLALSLVIPYLSIPLFIVLISILVISRSELGVNGSSFFFLWFVLYSGLESINSIHYYFWK